MQEFKFLHFLMYISIKRCVEDAAPYDNGIISMLLSKMPFIWAIAVP